jgi:hypothetical protein
MPYTPTNWENEIPSTTPIKYKITLTDGTVIAADATIEIVTPVTPGTPFNSANMNHIEQGVKDANDPITQDRLAAGASKVTNRQGGSAGAWDEPGSLNFAVTNARIQIGSKSIPVAETTITFPVPFSQIPIVVFGVITGTQPVTAIAEITGKGIDGFTVRSNQILNLEWLAIGPE